MRLLLIAFIAFPVSLFGQQNNDYYKPHGSIIFPIICNDGILLISDSRAVFTDTIDGASKYIAYTSRNKKLFKIKNFWIGITGLTMIGNKYFHNLISSFNSTNYNSIYIDSVFVNFKRYLNKHFNISDEEIFYKNQYYLAGFENGIPKIVGYKINDYLEKSNVGGTFADPTMYKYVEKYGNLKKNNDTSIHILYCSIFADIAEKAIYEFAQKENLLSIGGPLYIIKIMKRNNFEFIKSFHSMTYNTYREYAMDIINGKIKVTYLVPNGKKRLLNLLTEGMKVIQD